MSAHAAAAEHVSIAETPVSQRLIVWCVGVFAFLNVYSIQAVLPMLMDDFHATPAEAGHTVGATVFGVALLSPFIGMLSDAWGRKRLLVTSMLLLGVPTAAAGFSHTLAELVLWRFLQGLAIPGITVVAMAYIAEEYQHHGSVAKMMAAYVSGSVCGGYLGRFLCGHISAVAGWREALWGLAALNLAGALFVAARLPASEFFVPNRAIGASLTQLGRHVRNRGLLAACAVGFCVLFALVGALTYVNVLLSRPPFNLTASGLANVFSVYLVGIVVTPLAGKLIARLGYRGALGVALATSATGLALTLVSDLPAVIVGLTLASSGTFLAQSSSISFLAQQVREGRSLASGLYNLSYYLGGAAGAALCGIAYTAVGWGGTVACVITAQSIAGLIAWRFWRHVRTG